MKYIANNFLPSIVTNMTFLFGANILSARNLDTMHPQPPKLLKLSTAI